MRYKLIKKRAYKVFETAKHAYRTTIKKISGAKINIIAHRPNAVDGGLGWYNDVGYGFSSFSQIKSVSPNLTIWIKRSIG